MLTRSQAREAKSQARSSSSASSATTVARLKAAEAARKQHLAEIAKREAAAAAATAAAVAAAEREAADATFEATVAAIEAEEVVSARSRATADWVERTVTGAASVTASEPPDEVLPCGHGEVDVSVHPAPVAEQVHDASRRSPEITRQLHKEALHLDSRPQQGNIGNDSKVPSLFTF
ncbi:tol-Pal system protein TolA-like [Ostrinia nubilalis]|uniref:tol-Pal system protein TolA-like n=1 Tax=Ostrinia nubilalis TaxID=29057 RepID=UPI0030826561